jgi:hypothetical protein
MNHTYRLVWNRVQRLWVPVAESARACGKATRGATNCRPFKPLLLCALALAGAQVQGAPQQGQVPAGQGSATITQSGTTTTIKQDSPKAVINWNSFNVGAGESVQFVNSPRSTLMAKPAPSAHTPAIHSSARATCGWMGRLAQTAASCKITQS